MKLPLNDSMYTFCTQVVKTRGTELTTIHISGQVAIDAKGQLVGKP